MIYLWRLCIFIYDRLASFIHHLSFFATCESRRTSWVFVRRTWPLRPLLMTSACADTAVQGAHWIHHPPAASQAEIRSPSTFRFFTVQNIDLGLLKQDILVSETQYEWIKHMYIYILYRLECSCCLTTSCSKLINSNEKSSSMSPSGVIDKIDAQISFLTLGPCQHNERQ